MSLAKNKLNQFKYFDIQQNQNSSEPQEDTFNRNIKKKTNTLVFKITENVVQLIIGSLTFISGLAWNNYLMKNHIILDNPMFLLIKS